MTPSTRRASSSKTTKKASASPGSKAKAAPPKTETKSLTLSELASAYVEHLAAHGKTESTVTSYRSDLAIALGHLGADTPLKTLTANAVESFFASKAVTHKRNGNPKAQPSILKTRRVLRMALVWAAENGWLDKAPLPAKTKAS